MVLGSSPAVARALDELKCGASSRDREGSSARAVPEKQSSTAATSGIDTLISATPYTGYPCFSMVRAPIAPPCANGPNHMGPCHRDSACTDAMSSAKNPVWAELVQLLPVVTLALPFIVRGQVDISHAGRGLLIAAALTVPVSALVLHKKHLLNPILVGTALWLWTGALAFSVPLKALARWLEQTQALGLFLGALLVGLGYTFGSPHGYVACRSSDSAWIRRASLGLLALTGACALVAYGFEGDVRLGGGLPFIVLNIARRVLTRRAPA